MLLFARSMKELHFGSLMEVYAETNLEAGRESWPDEPEARQIQLAEQAFYAYLSDSFFKTTGAVYAVWTVEKTYVSALRTEPYRNGILLEALETAPGQRRKGYASALIRGLQAHLKEQGTVKLYSHVSKQNVPSLKIHEECGFRRIAGHAAYIDGSVDHRAYTLCYET